MQKQEIEKLNKEIVLLQTEISQMQSERNIGSQDSDTQSVSESLNEQNQLLINNLRQKNKQISQLLSDIEVKISMLISI